MENLIERILRNRERRIESLARGIEVRLQRKSGNGRKRREYHNVYYWSNAERRRLQRLNSHERLGKAHKYLSELRQQERRHQPQKESST